MANRYLNLDGTKRIQENYTLIPEGFDKVQQEMDTNKGVVDNHLVSTTAHPAQNIPYSGSIIGAENTKQALDKLKQEINDLVLGGDDTDPNTRAEVEIARGGHDTLGDRLDSSDAQLADKANQSSLVTTNNAVALKAEKTYVDEQVATRATKSELIQAESTLRNDINTIASGSPKGTYATLSDLQTAYPTGTTGIYVVTADGNWYYWNGSTWTAGGTYQSTGIGDNSVTLKKVSTDIKNGIAGYDLLDDYTLQNAFINRYSGQYTTHPDYYATSLIACSEGDKFEVTGATDTQFSGLISLFSSSQEIVAAYEPGNDSLTNYNEFEFTVPSNPTPFKYIAITSYKKKPTIRKYRVYNLPSRIEKLESGNSYWKGKKIVWFGTSIPAGGYPQLVGELLGSTVYNEALGNSPARAGRWDRVSEDDPLGWKYLYWEVISNSLSQTLTEKQSMIDNWETIWGNPSHPYHFYNAPDTLTNAQKTAILDSSYEKRLVERHLGANRADLYVFDHGWNDGAFMMSEEISTIPADKYDRTYFVGAMNFLIKKILEDNPRARIVMVGHYENDRRPFVNDAQEIVANYWNIPLLKLWKKTGWSMNEITKDTVTKSIIKWYMPDELHPSSDATGETNRLYAEMVGEFIKTIR